MLRELRSKPDSIKKRISFTGSVALTLLIALVWLSASQVDERDEAAFQTAQSAGPLDSLIRDVKMIFTSVEEPLEEESIETEVKEKEVYFDPTRDPAEFDGTVWAPDPRN